MNAIKFDTTYWYAPTSLVAGYLLIDFMRSTATDVYLISALTWQGWESIIFSVLLTFGQFFIFIVFSFVSDNKTLDGAVRII